MIMRRRSQSFFRGFNSKNVIARLCEAIPLYGNKATDPRFLEDKLFLEILFILVKFLWCRIRVELFSHATVAILSGYGFRVFGVVNM